MSYYGTLKTLNLTYLLIDRLVNYRCCPTSVAHSTCHTSLLSPLHPQPNIHWWFESDEPRGIPISKRKRNAKLTEVLLEDEKIRSVEEIPHKCL